MAGQFLGQASMAAVKRRIEIENSLIKRGEVEDLKHTQVVMCGCDFGRDEDPTCCFIANRAPKKP